MVQWYTWPHLLPVVSILLVTSHVEAFTPLPGRYCNLKFDNVLNAKPTPEYTILAEDSQLLENQEVDQSEEPDHLFINLEPESDELDARRSKSHPEDDVAGKGNRETPEYAALSHGTVIQIQVGDLRASRKVWKKRRRSGSPLLIPCSVLSVDRQSMVRWNLLHLLDKFGKQRKDGIQITTTEISKRYRGYLKSTLSRQATSLGFSGSNSMLKGLFSNATQRYYGVQLVEQNEGELALKAPISRTKAQLRASGTPMLQFRLPNPDDQVANDTLVHTGYVRTRNKGDPDQHTHSFLPLSAALRVSQQEEVDTSRIESGSVLPAVVLDYEKNGDGGLPLLTVSLNPRGVRESLKFTPDHKYESIDRPSHYFHHLSLGDGPFRAKVVQMQKGQALVDFGVGRKLKSGEIVKVLGTLMFQDAMEIDERDDTASHPLASVNTHKRGHNDEHSRASTESFFITKPEETRTSTIGFDGVFDTTTTEPQYDVGAVETDSEADGADHEEDDGADHEGDDGYEELGTGDDDEEYDEEVDVSDQFHLSEDGTLIQTDPETGETSAIDIDMDDEDSVEEFESSAGDDDDDLSNLFRISDDGTISFTDPDSGEELVSHPGEEDYEDMVAIKSAIDQVSDFEPEQVSESRVSSYPTTGMPESKPKLVSKWLEAGDDIDVFIRSVSKQSGQVAVTTNPLIQGRKGRDLKLENKSEKRLSRLKKHFGGSLTRIWDVVGQECDGIVRAASSCGKWCYVEPELERFPVGIAFFEDGFEGPLDAGDEVRVRIAGVDEQRGQLAMDLLRKTTLSGDQ